MKSLEEFLGNLVDLGVKLWIEDGRLRCRASKGKLTPEIKTELSQRKEEILQFLQRSQLDSSRVDVPIQPVSRTKNLPLSFSQQRLWILEQIEDENVAYNEGGAVHLKGSLEVETLQKSLEEIVRRHEVIRTNIQTINGEPYQVINETSDLHLEKIDISQLSPEKQQETWKEIAFHQFQLPFDLEKDLLLRVILVRLGETSHNLLLIMHHIVCDGWSFGVLIREFSTLYRAFQANLPSPLPELKVQYADYAIWQRKWLSEQRLQNQLDYWKKKLVGLSPLLELPLDYPRPLVQTFKGATEIFSLSQGLTQKLNQLSQELDATLYMTLISAFSIFLSRYSRQEDIVIGSPIANRKRSEIEPLIGFFLNTLVIRVDLEENPTVVELIKQVKKTCLEAYAHQDIPFEKLVEEFQPERNMSHTPLFQVVFILQNAPTQKLKLPGLTVSNLELDRGVAKFDLTLSVVETEQGLTVNWEYNTNLFEKETIKRMMGHFQFLLEEMVTNPEKKIGKLSLLQDAEKQKIVVEWNDTAANYPKDKCIHQLLEEQVEKTPNAVALVYENQQLTYQQLNQKANQLAHYLQKLGVTPDTLVGICVERSVEMVIGLLGILKAGGAYVPIDPNYPQERIFYVIKDSNMRVLLTQQHLKNQLEEIEIPIISWEQEQENIIQNSVINPPSLVHSKHLAYVIYTSGSTGRPKGVQIEHQSVINFLNSMSKRPGITKEDQLLAVTTISFDIATLELYLPLSVGGKILLATQETASDGQKLADLLQKSSATMMQATPATWRMLMAANWKGKSNLKILCGGEALPGSLVNQLRDKTQEIWNVYGPTETTVWSSTYFVKESSDTLEIRESVQPIGYPIDNTQFYILDSNLQPVPMGVEGELHIGGDGLARGYLNRPELTAEKFIPNPFGEGKLYKTGDLCRYLPDGNLEYIERIDHQVKIRGFRIEIGEIEAQLSKYPKINESAVIAREDGLGNKQLVAYIVPEDMSQTSVTQKLRDHLKKQLPDYMIPSAFIVLEKLPLTPSGKIDRKALSNIEHIQHIQKDYVAPRDSVERILANIWENILNIPLVGIKDNFFDLGGNSLLAVRLMAQIQQKFAKVLPLASLFNSPTIEKLANLLSLSSFSISWSPLVTIQSQGEGVPFFCVPGTGGNVIYLYDLAKALGTNRPFYGLQAKGLDGDSHPHTKIEDMASEYIEAMKSIQCEGPYLVGGHSFGGSVAFEITKQLQEQGDTVALLAMLDRPAPQYINKLGERNWDDAVWITKLIGVINELWNLSLEVSEERLRKMSSSEQMNCLQKCLQDANFVAPNGDIRQANGLFQVFKANYSVSYTPQNSISIPITLFRAMKQQNAIDGGLTETISDPFMGWQQWTTSSVEVYDVPGTHLTIMSSPNVQVLADFLNDSIFNSLKDLQ